MPIKTETELYGPVKLYLEQLGYEVRGEVNHCDVVALCGDQPPVIVELKKTFSIPLLIQGIDRLRKSDCVYVAFEKKEHGRAPHQLKWSDVRRLCQMLGLGIMTVRFYKRKPPLVEVLCHPEPYSPRKNSRQALRLISEFRERSGDYNVGGSNKRKVVTAYREQALLCAYYLKLEGPLSPKQLKERTGYGKIPGMLQRNVYLWFRRISRGLYGLTAEGDKALQEYAFVIEKRLGSGVSPQPGAQVRPKAVNSEEP